MAAYADKMKRHLRALRASVNIMAVTAGSLIILLAGAALAAEMKQPRFTTPERAVEALVSALKADNSEALATLLGPGSERLASSGDPVADEAERQRFLERYAEKRRLEAEGDDRVVLHVGEDDWPMAIPLVRVKGGWQFDAEAGAEEMLARRIGRNELDTIQTCLAYVDAQREYAAKDRDGDGLFEYAQRFASAPGRQNGLYWEAGEAEEQSPLGPFFAEAQEEGYFPRNPGSRTDAGPRPYHGYYYRILMAQGEDAPGGAYDYRVGDRMIGGFALVAYPAEYGSSGIMTFLTNHDGRVYQKDLGGGTESLARAMTLFNPDDTWEALGGLP